MGETTYTLNQSSQRGSILDIHLIQIQNWSLCVDQAEWKITKLLCSLIKANRILHINYILRWFLLTIFNIKSAPMNVFIFIEYKGDSQKSLKRTWKINIVNMAWKMMHKGFTNLSVIQYSVNPKNIWSRPVCPARPCHDHI